MGAPITIQDMLRFILYLLGIGVLGYLIVIFKNLASIFIGANKLLAEKEEELSSMITESANVTKNVSHITETVDDTLKSMAPELDGIVHSANQVSGKIDSMTTVLDNATYKVGETVDSVTDSINDTAYAFNKNMNNISSYMTIINEIIEIIKNIITKR